MRVLVTETNRGGVTHEVAGRIAARLRAHGLVVSEVPIGAVDEVESYDAIVVGGETSGSHWARPARRFVHRHEEELARRPVWLFSTGGPGSSARPREFDEFHAVVEPEDETAFTGVDDDAIDAWAKQASARLEQLRRDRAIDAVHQMSTDDAGRP